MMSTARPTVTCTRVKFTNGRVQFFNGTVAPYVRWHDGFPASGNRPKMGMRVEEGPAKHMFNDPSTYTVPNALCRFPLDVSSATCQIVNEVCLGCDGDHDASLGTQDRYTLEPTGDFCPIMIGNRCYRIIGRPSRSKIFTHEQARAECRSLGGNLAPIRSRKHYEMVYELASIMYSGTVWIWLGMYYEGNEVRLEDGTLAPYVRWHNNFPASGDRPRMGMRIESGPARHMYNDPVTQQLSNALCEIGLREMADGATRSCSSPSEPSPTAQDCSSSVYSLHVQGDFCPIIYRGTCYRIIGRAGSEVRFSHFDAESECKTMGGRLAPILSEEHYDMVYNLAGQMHSGTMLIWLGMHYLNGQVQLEDGTPGPYVRWHDGFPVAGDRPNIGMRIENGPAKHMFNDPASYKQKNALCQFALKRRP